MLLLPGYWPTTYYPRNYWEPDYWPHFNVAVSGGAAPGHWEPMEWPWRVPEDDDEVLVILA